MFLAPYCKQLIAVDGSKVGIENCVTRAEQKGISNIEFLNALIDDTTLAQQIENKVSDVDPMNPLYIYSRFFLHSINDHDELQLVALVDQLLGNRQGSFFIEFRTTKDEQLSKYTGEHYRRYVEPSDFSKKFTDIGYVVEYFVEGLGYAKYKVDDAHVARFILTKR
jgi:tellurite methyltransferase